MTHADKYYGMPGPGGSLGKCAICGNNFVMEIVMGKSVESFKVDAVDQILFGHDNCIKDLKANIKKNGTALVADLPDGPLKAAMDKTNERQAG